MVKNELSSSAKKVQDILSTFNKTYKVKELPDSTRTAKDAALAIGCDVAQIVKSIVFMSSETKRAVMVIASGTNRINEAKISSRIAESVVKADGDFVRNATGYAIGGVPPVGQPSSVIIFIDGDLMQYEKVWAAAGTPHAVFELNPLDLPALSGGLVIDIH
jgi:prolyl-tRNA editing enzyme YbaK/EbsC (Cys-tRNA(Pro) deacylase)